MLCQNTELSITCTLGGPTSGSPGSPPPTARSTPSSTTSSTPTPRCAATAPSTSRRFQRAVTCRAAVRTATPLPREKAPALPARDPKPSASDHHGAVAALPAKS
eukprot:5838017-Prymnesium_polylepis.2